MSSAALLTSWLERRCEPATLAWLSGATAEVAGGVEHARFSALLSLASRHARRTQALAPTADERAEAGRALEGWEPERWSVLDALRVALLLARPDLAEDAGAAALEDAFRYADEGELIALYRSLAHLPAPERFAWRAGEGCRTNMRTVFEAAALDTPYPARWFDDVAWRQAVIKCVFVEAPLWRMWGLDGRLDAELARMALDLADERRSAHRPVQPELWLALGAHGGERGRASLVRELDASNPFTLGRRAAVYALARSGEDELLRERRASEADDEVAATLDDALTGNTAQTAFRALRADD